MKSRVHPKYKTKYRVGNWPAYDRALVQRGDVTLWLAPEAIARLETAGVGKRGGQLQYSDVAIETALTLRLLFHLPLRQTEGFLRSIFGMLCLDLSAPEHTTLSRRAQGLNLTLRRVPTGTGIHLLVDSTGLSMVGEGEWAAVKHGSRGTRGWKKLPLGVCQGRSKIRPRWRRKTRPAGHWTECLKAAVRGKASGPRGGRVLAGVLAVCEAIAVAVQLQDVDVMGESVEACTG